MQVVRSISECRRARLSLGRLALVPTMGALHAGHLSLITEGKRHAAAVAVSIFVNPTQFAPHEDFHNYPRPLEADLELCRDAGVDLVFVPEVVAMYPPGAAEATIDVPQLTRTLEGAKRPGHFAGVCQVVTKLFNIITPEVACFGEKDFQQLAVLTAMARSLDLPVEIVPCPTLRDPDGLAMSSRNRYLSPAERARALSISRALSEVTSSVAAGERDCRVLQRQLLSVLNDGSAAPDVRVEIDYATLVDHTTFADLSEIDRPARALVAMRVGKPRLIDNVAIE